MAIDAQHGTTPAQISVPAVRTSTVTESGVDLRDYVGGYEITQDVGVVSGTSPTLDGKIQDSADNSAFADVSGATFTQVTATNNIQSIRIDVDAVRRYIRYVGTIGGTASPSFTMGVNGRGIKQVN